MRRDYHIFTELKFPMPDMVYKRILSSRPFGDKDRKAFPVETINLSLEIYRTRRKMFVHVFPSKFKAACLEGPIAHCTQSPYNSTNIHSPHGAHRCDRVGPIIPAGATIRVLGTEVLHKSGNVLRDRHTAVHFFRSAKA